MIKLDNIRRNKRSAITVIIAGIALGLFYPIMGDSFDDPIAFLNGFLIGLLGACFIVFFELHLFYFPKKKMHFLFSLSTKVIIYTFTVILLIVGIYALRILAVVFITSP